jgi:hypothetical protein
VLLDAGGHREDVRVEDDVLGREADLLGEDAVAALADLGLALERVGLALLVEGHARSAGAVAARELRVLDELRLASLSEIEFTIALPCTHLRPASITTTSSCRS